jgi:hypothetical protein
MRFSTGLVKELDAGSIAKSKTFASNGKITTQENKMKTRQELVLDFMLALSANPSMTGDDSSFNIKDDVDYIHQYATFLANKYLENI